MIFCAYSTFFDIIHLHVTNNFLLKIKYYRIIYNKMVFISLRKKRDALKRRLIQYLI